MSTIVLRPQISSMLGTVVHLVGTGGHLARILPDSQARINFVTGRKCRVGGRTARSGCRFHSGRRLPPAGNLSLRGRVLLPSPCPHYVFSVHACLSSRNAPLRLNVVIWRIQGGGSWPGRKRKSTDAWRVSAWQRLVLSRVKKHAPRSLPSRKAGYGWPRSKTTRTRRAYRLHGNSHSVRQLNNSSRSSRRKRRIMTS